MQKNKSVIPQHEPLRVPQGWNEQDRSLVIQIERVHDDIYKHFKPLTIKDFSPELIAALKAKMEEIDDE